MTYEELLSVIISRLDAKTHCAQIPGDLIKLRKMCHIFMKNSFPFLRKERNLKSYVSDTYRFTYLCITFYFNVDLAIKKIYKLSHQTC